MVVGFGPVNNNHHLIIVNANNVVLGLILWLNFIYLFILKFFSSLIIFLFPPFPFDCISTKINFHGKCPESQIVRPQYFYDRMEFYLFSFFLVFFLFYPMWFFIKHHDSIPICVSFIRFAFHCFKCAHNLYGPLFRLPLNMHLHNLFFIIFVSLRFTLLSSLCLRSFDSLSFVVLSFILR